MMTDIARGRPGWRSGFFHAALWAVLALPLVASAAAMRLAPQAGVNWTARDFIAAGLLLGLVGLGVELVVRASSSLAWRAAAFVAIGTAFLTVWTNLAVGMIGDEDNPYNLAFAAVLLVAAVGAVAARLRAAGTARAMVAAAAAQAAAGGIGVAADPRGGILSVLFAVPWLVSAALFARAARDS